MSCRTSELTNYSTVGPVSCRTIQLSDQWAFGQMSFIRKLLPESSLIQQLISSTVHTRKLICPKALARKAIGSVSFRTNELLYQWAFGQMRCWINELTDKWAVGSVNFRARAYEQMSCWICELSDKLAVGSVNFRARVFGQRSCWIFDSVRSYASLPPPTPQRWR
jgi:hypothetical protein